MKIKDILKEAPQLIDKLDSVSIQQAEKDCTLSIKNSTCKEAEKLNDKTSLYLFSRSPISGCYFLATEDKIDYLVNFTKVEQHEKVLPNKVGIRQVLIKRFPNASGYASGIGAHIFWDILFKEYECLISDNQQTDNGKQFWEYRVVEAFNKGLIVRLINTNDNTFIDIKDQHQLENLNKNIWGTSKWFQRIILVIFKE